MNEDELESCSGVARGLERFSNSDVGGAMTAECLFDNAQEEEKTRGNATGRAGQLELGAKPTAKPWVAMEEEC